MLNKKKAISPVVATALLIVVTVISVISFQGWFQNFSSALFTNTEEQSSLNSMNTKIDSLIGDQVYFYNGYSYNLTINSIKIGKNDCNISLNISSGLKNFTVTKCLENLSNNLNDITIVTNKGIFIKNVYISVLPEFIPTLSFVNTNNTEFELGILVSTQVNGTGDGASIILQNSTINYWSVDKDYSTGGQDEVSSSTIYQDTIYYTGSFSSGILGARIQSRNISNGSIIVDTDFSTGSFYTVINDIKLDSTSLYYTGGDAYSGTESYCRVYKKNLDLSAVWNRFYFPTNEHYRCFDIAIENSSYLYVIGMSQNYGNTVVHKMLKSNGAFSWSNVIDFASSTNEYPNAIEVDNLGFIYIGINYIQGGVNNYWSIQKRDSGTANNINWSYTSVNLGSTVSLKDIKYYNDAIYAVGYQSSPSSSERIMKFNATTGTVIWTKTNITNLKLNSIWIDSSGVYSAGTIADSIAYVEKRDFDGNILWSKISTPHAGNNWFNTISGDSNYLYLGGLSVPTGTSGAWRVEKRSKSSGDMGIFNEYFTNGNFTSQVFDTTKQSNFTILSYTSSTPINTGFSVNLGAGNTSSPDGNWIWMNDVLTGADISSLNSNRYVQYRAYFNTTNLSVTPKLDDIRIEYK